RVERLQDEDHIEVAPRRVRIAASRRTVQHDAPEARAESLHEPLQKRLQHRILLRVPDAHARALRLRAPGIADPSAAGAAAAEPPAAAAPRPPRPPTRAPPRRTPPPQGPAPTPPRPTVPG